MFSPIIVNLSRDIAGFKMLTENSNVQLLHGLFVFITNCRMRWWWWWLGVDGVPLLVTRGDDGVSGGAVGCGFGVCGFSLKM